MNFKKYFYDSLNLYTTTRLVQVRSPTIATVSCILFIIVWISFLASIRLDLNRVFKSNCPVRGAVLTKVKGFASTEHFSDDELLDSPELYRKTWDPTELVYPVQGGEAGTGSFTIVTNVVITPNQTLTTCADRAIDAKKTPKLMCRTNSDCEKGYWGPETHGILTGKCVNNGTNGTACEIKGWCPIEPPRNTFPRFGNHPLIEHVADFTVLLKNTVDFPGCSDRVFTNIANETHDYLRTCIYDNENHPFCPKFRIGDILDRSGEEFDEVAVNGGVFRIRIKWTCEFDFWRTASRENCRLRYKFSRVDDPDAGVSRGWNFRSATYSGDKRTVMKNYGLKILIDLEGEGRQFDFFLFITTLGSTIGLFSVTPLICDYLVDLFNWLGKRRQWGKEFHEYCDRFETTSCKAVAPAVKNVTSDFIITNSQ